MLCPTENFNRGCVPLSFSNAMLVLVELGQIKGNLVDIINKLHLCSSCTEHNLPDIS